jgi:hypothetical protein
MVNSNRINKKAFAVVLLSVLLFIGYYAAAQRASRKKYKKTYLSETGTTDNKQVEDSEAGKKRKGKENNKNTGKTSASKEERQGDKKETVQEKKTTIRRKQEIAYPDSKMKKKYSVSVILPLYLDELVRGESVTFKDKVPVKAADGLAFYQGVKLAADSLRRSGAKFDIRIFDAGSFNESPEMLINRRKLDSADLIIGAVEQHDIPVLAGYARKKKINFVSALTNYDAWVKDNQYFTMLLPSVKSHCEYIIDKISEKYSGQNVALLYRTSALADDNAALYMLNDLYSDVTFRKLQCNTMPTKEEFAAVFDTSRPNAVVVSILNLSFADSLLKLFSEYFPNTHFDIYGMPTWSELPELRKNKGYKNLAVNVTNPFYYDAVDSTMIFALRRNYKNEFAGVPSDMVLRGYECMMWYGTLLRKYGTIFNDDYSDISVAPFTKFRVKPRWDANGSLLYLENKQIYMTTYQGGVSKTR